MLQSNLVSANAQMMVYQHRDAFTDTHTQDENPTSQDKNADRDSRNTETDST